MSESSLISVTRFYRGIQKYRKHLPPFQEVLVFLPNHPVLTWGQQLLRSHSHHEPLHAPQEPLSGLRTHWSLNYNGFYLIKRGIAHTAEECLRKSIRGVLSLLLLSIENKVHVARMSQRSHPILSINSKGENSMLSCKVRYVTGHWLQLFRRLTLNQKSAAMPELHYFFPLSPY